MLTDDERRLLAHASVFVGGFTLDAARAVGGAALSTPSDVAGLVAALARKSLLHATHRNGTTRFAMLDTVREYSSQRLVDLGDREVAAAVDQLAQLFADLEKGKAFGGHFDRGTGARIPALVGAIGANGE